MSQTKSALIINTIELLILIGSAIAAFFFLMLTPALRPADCGDAGVALPPTIRSESRGQPHMAPPVPVLVVITGTIIQPFTVGATQLTLQRPDYGFVVFQVGAEGHPTVFAPCPATVANEEWEGKRVKVMAYQGPDATWRAEAVIELEP
jgi:hypothetical protein